MKFVDISIISLIFLFGTIISPVLSPDIVITTVPEEPQSLPLHVNQPILIISVDHTESVKFNLTRLDKESVVISHEFTGEYKIDGLTVGMYRLDIVSAQLGEITINRTGFYTLPLVLFVFIGLVNLYLIYRKSS